MAGEVAKGRLRTSEMIAMKNGAMIEMAITCPNVILKSNYQTPFSLSAQLILTYYKVFHFSSFHEVSNEDQLNIKCNHVNDSLVVRSVFITRVRTKRLERTLNWLVQHTK